ncbi:MAG: ATP-binding protein [Spirochaetota bacterium]
MKCGLCFGKAQVELIQHKIAMCGPCYLKWVPHYTQRTIKNFRMFSHQDPVLVAVSGGKDSLSLWSILTELGYQADALYINLGILENNYSAYSLECAQQLASTLGRKLHVIDLEKEQGFRIPQMHRKIERNICSACGVIKRYYMNLTAYQEGYHCVATGHNLDDESSSLLSNVLSWDVHYLSRQSPVLPEKGQKLVKKVKPLCYFTEKETAQYAFLKQIEYIGYDCPYVKGSTFLYYKDLLNQLEQNSAGSKRRFYDGFLRVSAGRFEEKMPELQECRHCGMPTPIDVCSFCRITQRAKKIVREQTPSQ